MGTIFFRCFVLKRGRGKPLRTHLHNPQPPDGESSRTHQIPLHSRPRAAIQQNPQAPLSKWLTPSDISRKNHRNHWRTSQMRTRQRDRSQEDGTSFGVDGICPGGGGETAKHRPALCVSRPGTGPHSVKRRWAPLKSHCHEDEVEALAMLWGRMPPSKLRPSQTLHINRIPWLYQWAALHFVCFSKPRWRGRWYYQKATWQAAHKIMPKNDTKIHTPPETLLA